MPLHESLSAKVTLTIEVDGHRLTFEEDVRRITGARYHGARPQFDAATAEILESEIRRQIGLAIAQTEERARELLRRIYPVYADREDQK